jgi:4,5-DOPA dioxygenase extradiol
MHAIEYPAKGDPALVRRVQELLSPQPIVAATDWGFDHGCWTVLMKAWPEANIPVVQLSLDVHRTPAEHFLVGRALAPLRDEGVLIMGSGNIVHNLRALDRRDIAPAHPLAHRFSQAIKAAIVDDDPQTVIEFAKLGDAARLSVPTPDHFWPLLYVLGARQANDTATFAPDFMQYGTIDMTSISFTSERAV